MKLNSKDLEGSYYVKFIIATFCLVLIIAAAIAHSNYMERKISDISQVYLSKISTQNAEIISGQIHSNLQTLDVIARMIAAREDFTLEEINDILTREAQNNNFISMGVVMMDGKIAFSPVLSDDQSNAIVPADPSEKQDGRKLLTASDWEYINKTMSRFSGLSGGPSRIVNGERVNIYALPIQREQTIGVLIVFFNKDFFENLILPGTLDEENCSYIADGSGNIIFGSPASNSSKQFVNVIEKLKSNWNLKGEYGEKIRSDIENGRGDTVECGGDVRATYISYIPIGYYDWYLVTLTDTTFAEAQSKGIYDSIMPAFIYLLLILMTIVIYFTYLRGQRFKRLERRMQLESINDESYRMIMEQTDDIIFEYDTLDKTYFHTANFRKNFGYEPTRTGFLGSLESDYVHPDDVIRFAELYEKMRQNRELAEAEVRIINSEGEYLWTKIYMLGVFDQDGKLARVIGKIVNIDAKKKELQYLKEKANKDSATGIYNKQTTENMIKNFLNGEGRFGKHAMLMIDIDDFKGINDDYGHRVGDAVISSLAAELKHIFRATDIKGRIGGDEFMVLLKDIEREGLDFIADKAGLICQMFKDYRVEDNKKIDFSVSIGIAFYDLDGSTYEELYEAADRALYNCKNNKKGTYAFCRETDSKISSR